MRKLAFFLLLVLNLSDGTKGHDELDKVYINVFYESLCPDSQRFINFRLKEAFLKFDHDEIDVKFIPFGNANVS